MDRNLQFLGLAKKAGALAIGAEDAAAAVSSGRAAAVISACDASENAMRRARNCADIGGVIFATVPYSKVELGNVSGRGSPGTIAFLDVGLAAGFMRGLAALEPEKYGEHADVLTERSQARAKKTKDVITGKRRTVQ